MYTRKNRALWGNVSLMLFLTFMFMVNPFTVHRAYAAQDVNAALPSEGTRLTVSDGKVTIPITITPVTEFGTTNTIQVTLKFRQGSTISQGVYTTNYVYATNLLEIVYDVPSGFGPYGVQLGPGSYVDDTDSTVYVVVYLDEVSKPPQGGGSSPVISEPTETVGTETGWQTYDPETGEVEAYVDPELTQELFEAPPPTGVVLVSVLPVEVDGQTVQPENVTASIPLEVVEQGGTAPVHSVLDLGRTSVAIPPAVMQALQTQVQQAAGSLGSLQVVLETKDETESQNEVVSHADEDEIRFLNSASQVVTLKFVAVDTRGNTTPVRLDQADVGFAFDPSKVTNAQNVNLYMLGSLIYVGGKVDLDNNKVIANLTGLTEGKFVAMEHTKTFTDVPEGYWGKSDIELMAAKYVIEGMTETTFEPESVVTRAQFVTMLVRSLGIAQENPAEPTFSDVAPGSWYYGYVEAAFKAGLAHGDAGKGGSFRPEASISREEMAALMVRAMKVHGAPAAELSQAEVEAKLTQFADGTAISDWARAEAAQAVNEGIIKGRDAGMFAPLGNGKRAEAATMMSRLMKQVGIL